MYTMNNFRDFNFLCSLFFASIYCFQNAKIVKFSKNKVLEISAYVMLINIPFQFQTPQIPQTKKI